MCLGLVCLSLTGCGGEDGGPDTGRPDGPGSGGGDGPAPPGGGGGDGPAPGPAPTPVTGTERIGWDQSAPNSEELATYGYFAYVDGVARQLTGVICTLRESSIYACAVRLPPMNPGVHSIQLSAFSDVGERLESPRSAPIQVRMAGATLVATAAAAGTLVRHVTTVDGIPLQVHVVASGLVDPTDLVTTPDGHVLIAERGGHVRLYRDGQLREIPALELDDVGGAGGLLALAVDPRFQENAAVYAVYTTNEGFRLARFNAAGDRLHGRAVLLDGVEAASAEPRAALRFGPDGKLYVAFDDGGDLRAAGDLGVFNGKVLRLNTDGTTPVDQAGGTPVYVTDVNRPESLNWSLDGSTLWMGERDADGADRLNEVVDGAGRGRGLVEGAPRRAETRARHTLPAGTGAGAATFYWSPAIPAFQGNLFVAAETAGALLRIRFDSPGSNTITGSEWILRDELGPIRAVAVAPDGSLYFCTADALLLITPE